MTTSSDQPDAPDAPRRLLGGWGPWLLGALGVVSVVHVLHPEGWVGTATYLAVTVGAGLVALVAAARMPRDQRRPWMWLAVGMTCSGVADLVFEVMHWLTGDNPDLSAADVFYLSSYVFLVLGLVGLARRSNRDDRDLLLDLGSFVVLSMIVVFQLVGGTAIITDGSVTVPVRLVSAAYPILDAALLAVLVKALLGRRLLSTPGIVLAVGLACWMASDFVYLLAADASVESVWTDLGWMLGASAVAVAATQVRSRAPLPIVAPREQWDLFLGLAPLAIPGAIAIWTFARGTDTNPVPMYVATLALVGLAFARSLSLLRARDENEAQLARSERYFHALAMNSAEAVMVVGPDGRLRNDEPNLMRMLGVERPHTEGAMAFELLMPGEPGRARAMLERLRASTGVNDFVLCVTHADGTDRWLSIRAVDMTADSDVGGLIVNVHDVTDRQRAEDELTHLAFHDSLTGLPNRALFHDRIDHAMRRNMRTGTDLAIVYLDLDGFKNVNDSLGHEAGDEVLRQTTSRIVAAVRPSDTVGRLGGDEFAILIESAERPIDEAMTVADRVLLAMRDSMTIGDTEVVLSASIGIAASDASSTSSSMMRDADIAMYQAKANGKGNWALYDAEMRSAVVERQALETDLARALVRDEFEVLYQPIVRLATGEVAGFEALLRWHHPVRGVILPEVFIPIAEDMGSIIAIGRWVLDEACRAAVAWQQRRPDVPLTMAVNVSTRQLAAPHIVDHVRTALETSGLDPAALILEMTESALVRDPEVVAVRLEQLHALGVRIAIDDFGTGYSSLSYLRQFSVDILKIDQSFVRTITDHERNPAVLRGLLELARTLDLETVAEGIEMNLQRDSLRDQRCEYGQGYLYARPMTGTAVGEMLDEAARPVSA